MNTTGGLPEESGLKMTATMPEGQLRCMEDENTSQNSFCRNPYEMEEYEDREQQQRSPSPTRGRGPMSRNGQRHQQEELEDDQFKDGEDRGGESDSLNSSWHELESSAERLLREEMDSVEKSFSPDMQLNFFKSWFEDNFRKTFLFGHFLRLVKYALYEHMPDMTVDKDYLPATLLSLMRTCFANYRRQLSTKEEKIEQLNRTLAENLESTIGDGAQLSQSMKEIILAYQQIIASATDRAINSREQAAGLQTQLKETMTRMRLLEKKLILLEKSPLNAQQSLSEIRNNVTSREDLERMVATEKALSDTLKSQLADEQRCNNKLWASLKDRNGHLAIMGAELATCVDDSSRKARLINILAGEISDNLVNTLVPSMISRIPEAMDMTSFANDVFSAWEDTIKMTFKCRHEEVQKLDRQLVNYELLFSDLNLKLNDKQETVKFLEAEYASLKQQERILVARLECQEDRVTQLHEKSKKTERRISLVRDDLNRKLDLLSCAKDRIDSKVREIALLQKLQVSNQLEDNMSERSSFSVNTEPNNIQSGLDTSSVIDAIAACDEKSAIKAFASFGGHGILRRSGRDVQWSSTPIKAISSDQEHCYPTSEQIEQALTEMKLSKREVKSEPIRHEDASRNADAPLPPAKSIRFFEKDPPLIYKQSSKIPFMAAEKEDGVAYNHFAVAKDGHGTPRQRFPNVRCNKISSDSATNRQQTFVMIQKMTTKQSGVLHKPNRFGSTSLDDDNHTDMMLSPKPDRKYHHQ